MEELKIAFQELWSTPAAIMEDWAYIPPLATVNLAEMWVEDMIPLQEGLWTNRLLLATAQSVFQMIRMETWNSPDVKPAGKGGTGARFGAKSAY